MSFVLCENCKWSYVDPGNKPGFHYECRLLPPDPNGKRPAVRGRDYCSRGEAEKAAPPGRDYRSLFYQMRQGLIKLQGNTGEPGVGMPYVQDALEDILRAGDRTLEEYFQEPPPEGHWLHNWFFEEGDDVHNGGGRIT